MKIRSDFVTNSSCASSTEIVIDNPLLLEILQRYKDLGLICEGNFEFEIGSYGTAGTPSEGDTKTPAFYLNYEDDFSVPQSLSMILESLIDVMGNLEQSNSDKSRLDENLLTQMKEEFQQRKDEINQAYVKVSWNSNVFMYTKSTRWWNFQFNQVDGESYEFEQKGKDDDFDNW